MSRYKIGLALSGGGTKGFTHIGVLRYLREIGLQPDIIAGTSAGSLVGALYSDGYSPEDMMTLMGHLKLWDVTKLRITRPAGMLDTSPLHRFVDEVLGHHKLEDLPIPLRIVATDLDHGCPVVFESGDLPSIVLASCSIPVLFVPVTIDGTTYVDGGLFRNFPASIIRDDCDILIGVNLSAWESTEYKKNFVSIAERSFAFLFRQNTLPDKALCDILLESSDLLTASSLDSSNAAELEELGYQLAKAQITPDKLSSLGL